MTEYKARLKAEEEARLVENSSHESKERASLKAEEEARFFEELKLKAKK